jgi:hypothetical protein
VGELSDTRRSALRQCVVRPALAAAVPNAVERRALGAQPPRSSHIAAPGEQTVHGGAALPPARACEAPITDL